MDKERKRRRRRRRRRKRIRRGVRFSTKPIIRCVSRQGDEERSPGYIDVKYAGIYIFVVDVIGNGPRERVEKFNFRTTGLWA